MKRRTFLALPVLAALPADQPPAVRPRFRLPGSGLVRFLRATVPRYESVQDSRDRLVRLGLRGPSWDSMVRLRETQLADLELRFWLQAPLAARADGGRRLAYVRRFLGTS